MLKILKCNRTQGYLPRHFLPSTLISLEYSEEMLTPQKIKEFDKAIISLLKKQKIKSLTKLEHACKSFTEPRVDLFKRFSVILELSMQAAGFPASKIRMASIKKVGAGKLIHHIMSDEIEGGTSNVLILLNTLVNWVNTLKNSDDVSSKFSSLYENSLKNISQSAPKGVNTLKFIQAAIELDIPCRKVAVNTFQFGWGSKSRWLDSSFTDKTPAISANLAKDKLACIHFLNQAGFPTPKSFLVKSVNQAIKNANHLGYPVVVKASNLDGGHGVYCDLKNEKEVTQAFEKAKKLSSKIMLEEYVLGKDYRLQVCQDEVYWAIERQGPKVMGDGKNNIAQLINKFNEDRTKKNINDETPLPLIELNEDIRDFLMLNGFVLESVPDQGREVKLRAANNIAGGGTLIPVLEITHPDNIHLAIEITKYLRLDLAGIDLIIPDIRKSWREQKSVVLEVNAMPQISGTRHKNLLPKLISGNGRIPSILFIGDLPQSSIHQKLIDLAEVKKINLGIASNSEACSNLVRKLSNSANLYQSTVHLISDPTINALILHINIESQLPFTFPIDRFDAIVLAHKVVKNSLNPEKTRSIKNLFAYSDILISLDQEAKALTDLSNEPKPKILNMSESKLINFLKELFD